VATACVAVALDIDLCQPFETVWLDHRDGIYPIDSRVKITSTSSVMANRDMVGRIDVRRSSRCVCEQKKQELVQENPLCCSRQNACLIGCAARNVLKPLLGGSAWRKRGLSDGWPITADLEGQLQGERVGGADCLRQKSWAKLGGALARAIGAYGRYSGCMMHAEWL
jgi:hypothetical protein